MSDITPREDVLQEAIRLITGDRNVTYGSPTQNFQDTADVLNVLLREKLKPGQKITPGEVASIMIGLKLVRQIAQPKRDNWTDIAGYAGCGYEADVETERIKEDTHSENHTAFGRPGDIVTLGKNDPEPKNVQVLREDLPARPDPFTGVPYLPFTGVPYLHKIRNDGWVWSAFAERIDRADMILSWSQALRYALSDRFEVIR